jgi:hypothetical protein
MDERLSKALEFANYSVTLNNQRRALKEKYLADVIYYHNGGCFAVTKELINFVKILIELDKSSAVLIDANSLPIDVADLKKFFDDVVDTHFTAINSYYSKYQKLKNSRTVESLINA